MAVVVGGSDMVEFVCACWWLLGSDLVFGG